jgi:hypothetical protein
MNSDLETLRTEIEEYLKTQDFVIFHGFPRLADPSLMLHWDVEGYPDYKKFLALPKQLGVQLIVFHHRKLAADFIEDALDQIDSIDLPDEEYVEMQRRIRELRVFEGFTSAVELSFEYQSRIYFYTARSEWYEELLDIVDHIDDYSHPEDAEFDEPEDDIGPYFSKN